jgi:hypothetical protein
MPDTMPKISSIIVGQLETSALLIMVGGFILFGARFLGRLGWVAVAKIETPRKGIPWDIAKCIWLGAWRMTAQYVLRARTLPYRIRNIEFLVLPLAFAVAIPAGALYLLVIAGALFHGAVRATGVAVGTIDGPLIDDRSIVHAMILCAAICLILGFSLFQRNLPFAQKSFHVRSKDLDAGELSRWIGRRRSLEVMRDLFTYRAAKSAAVGWPLLALVSGFTSIYKVGDSQAADQGSLIGPEMIPLYVMCGTQLTVMIVLRAILAVTYPRLELLSSALDALPRLKSDGRVTLFQQKVTPKDAAIELAKLERRCLDYCARIETRRPGAPESTMIAGGVAKVRAWRATLSSFHAYPPPRVVRTLHLLFAITAGLPTKRVASKALNQLRLDARARRSEATVRLLAEQAPGSVLQRVLERSGQAVTLAWLLGTVAIVLVGILRGDVHIVDLRP